jgi:EAL domain-containing protein (putative c-di-GMP-specific phosphodiesterase class I)/CheY-like chemotaxis protein
MSVLAPPAVVPPSTQQLAYVLDDNPQVRAILSQLLVLSGFVSREFEQPAPLFENIKQASPDLIVLDLALGQSDAIDVIRDLQAACFKGKVLLISGRDEATLEEFHRIGEHRGLIMLPPLKKPFRAADLKNRLAAMVDSKALPERPMPGRDGAQQVRIDPDEALKKQWLVLWYQAKIDLKSMAVCGAEALLRVNHPRHGIVLPAAFLPESGSPLYRPLTRFVIEQAVVDWKYFADKGQQLKLAINVPLSVLQEPSFINLVRDTLPRHAAFSGMIIEVTESDAMVDPDGIREIATQLKLHNIGLSIDDFGEGHSSLARLRDLPCVELKLDRSFVSGCAKDRAKHTICKATIELARGFGVIVCAEGVEDPEDLRALTELGCHTAQGFLFGKAMDPVSFVKTLIARLSDPKENQLAGGPR